MTCKDCKNFKCCMERSRDYPCREFKNNVRAPTMPNKANVSTNAINYPQKNNTAKTAAQNVTEVQE